jgi:DNA-binding transcriptional regulator YiaG/mRNA-degrading endonuclease RelE of RelBE toxin-antitoxin system
MGASVIEFIFTPTFFNQWYRLGLNDSDLEDLKQTMIDYYVSFPVNAHGKKFPGSIIVGTGGAFKLRYSPEAGRKEKSGGYRIIYFILNGTKLAFLSIYQKGKKDSLSNSEKTAIKAVIKKSKGVLIDVSETKSELLQSIHELNDYLDGDYSKVVTEKVVIKDPPAFDAASIKHLRNNLAVTQRVMANVLAVSPRTVEAWEAGRTEPSGSSRRLLELLSKHPNVINYLKD